MIGKNLAHFSITAKLGAGGMGEVYRAEDGKLGREVAIKVLPAAVASDPDRLTRFEREAQVLAALNHPRIAAIYQVEEADGVHFLVMELVEGEDLARRIARGPIPLDQTLAMAAQIATALEAAHDRGVVHRDLKPANVKVTPDEQIKVLDFGLAKALLPPPASDDADLLSRSPTLAQPMTDANVLLGTAPYMSPEQARGREVDRRADVWAFGCLLFEMLTGKLAFRGETVSDTIAVILEREPPLEELPPETPPSVRQLIARCLRKDPGRRLRDMGDVRLELEEAGEEPGAALAAPPRRSGGLSLALLVLAVTGLSLAAWAWLGGAPVPPAPTSRWVVALEADLQIATGGRSNPMAISPDGARIVYAAETQGNPRLYVRELSRFESDVLPGTEGARNPFFSPDGEWVGFFSGNRLLKVSLQGGSPRTLCEIPLDDLGASWSPEGFIVFATYGSGLARVPSEGGTPEPLTTLDYEGGEVQHRWPQVLPGGRHVLFTVAATEGSHVSLVSLADGDRLPVRGPVDVSRAWYSPDGRLIYGQAGGLMGVSLDLGSLQTSGNPTSVLDGVASVPDLGNAYFAISESGTIAYVPGGASGETELVWVDRKGRESPAVGGRAAYMHVRLSPDGGRVAVSVGSEMGARQILLFDLERGTRSVLAKEGSGPSWTPDGAEVVYSSNRSGSWSLYRARADGSDPGELLLDRGREQWVGNWSPDGRVVSFYEVNPEAGRDIWMLDLEGGEPTPFLTTAFNERSPRFSPNGRWLAYVSNESGRDEVYVEPYPGRDARWTISTDGGREPLWSADGTELFYRQSDRMLAVAVGPEPGFTAGKPRVLFEGRYEVGVAGNPNYDVARDAQRFLMLKREEGSAPTRIHVVLNWFTELGSQLSPGG